MEDGEGKGQLGGAELEQAQEHAPLKAKVIHEIIREEGESELKRGVGALWWSGLAAGLSMGFSFLTQALLHANLPDAPWRHLAASGGYVVGFAIVVLGRQQLFTESTLSAVLPAFTRRDLATTLATLRLWAIVLAANLTGTWLFAAALTLPHLLRPETYPSLLELARDAVSGEFWPTLLKAVFAGWLIALMVWLLPSARSARILVIALLTYVVALARLSHIVAGSTEAALAVLWGEAGAGDYLFRFLVPTLIGNTIGGVALVALLNHAPVAPELATGGEGDGGEDF